jgi:hypothetical protein
LKSYLWLPVVMPSSNQQNRWGWNFSHPGANGTILIASSSSPSSTDQSQVSFFQRNQEFFALELCLVFPKVTNYIPTSIWIQMYSKITHMNMYVHHPALTLPQTLKWGCLHENLRVDEWCRVL